MQAIFVLALSAGVALTGTAVATGQLFRAQAEGDPPGSTEDRGATKAAHRVFVAGRSAQIGDAADMRPHDTGVLSVVPVAFGAGKLTVDAAPRPFSGSPHTRFNPSVAVANRELPLHTAPEAAAINPAGPAIQQSVCAIRIRRGAEPVALPVRCTD